jgi:hypothetical protein
MTRGALEAFGTAASSAVPDLLLAAGDEDEGVRVAVTNALRKIAPEVLKKDGPSRQEMPVVVAWTVTLRQIKRSKMV